ncbi:MAG: BamA/TamA family outer membrane protein [Bacteroidales bacterium]|nr:BamA/TamA family outer membrane protein [Bacteroidales bacterium]
MRTKLIHSILLFILATLFASCSIKRFVPEGQSFLDKNKIVIENTPVEFKKSDISSYIEQKTFNARFPYRTSLWWYYVTEKKTDRKFWRWVNQFLGRQPEYYDANATYNSAKQIEQYLNNRGYFNSKVTYDTKKVSRRKKHLCKTVYTIHPTEPYRISKIHYQIEDTVIARSIMRLQERFPAKEGDIYNSYTLDEQRTYITSFLRNSGYFFFTKDYITYEVDSSFNNHTLEVTMKIANVKDRNTNEYHPHKLYTIRQINIYPNYSPFLANTPPTDSVTIDFSTGLRDLPNSLNFYFHDKPYIRPRTFTDIIQIYKGRPYRERGVSLTYSALSSLKIVSNSSIEFDTVPSTNDTLNLLDCNILLRRANTHSIKVQTEGTNSGGDLGISGSVTYTNKNIFKGAEVLQVSLKGGLEAQEIIDLGDVEEDDGYIFNTSELIFNSSLYIPRFLSPIPFKTFARDYQPRTTFSLGGSMQIRYAYSRYINMGSFGYDWKANPRTQFIVTPFYLNAVKVNPIPSFQAILDQENNQRIKDQYTDHLIFGGRYSFIYNTQNYNKTNNYIYLRGNIESSGGILSLFNKTRLLTESQDHHELFGIRYAQYFRGDIDFRQYYRLRGNTWLVFRQLVGFGLPYGNSYDMPFERSFYSGGSTGMRGWHYRKLGPGAYIPNDDVNIERIGDLQLECNAEIRFPVYNSFNGALFIDAGNVWNYHANELLPNGEFHFNTFYQQIAVDAGVGVRMDFNLAIVRLDLAMPIRNPYPNTVGNHWRFDDMSLLDMRLVLNIGYPF